MKKNVWIMTLLLIVSSFSMKLAAQENLDALVKKCETMESVDTNIMRTRNSETKKIERETINIKFCKNPALLNEFVTAFKKDAEKAVRANENRKGGRVISLYYQFENVRYTLSQKDEECISISVITGQNVPITTTTYSFPATTRISE